MTTQTAAFPRPLPLVKRTLIFLTIVVPIIGTFLAVTLVGFGRFNWIDLPLLVITYCMGALSITIGYHRLLSHDSFIAHPVLKLILLMLGASASMGAPLGFGVNHKHHHRHSDGALDLHSPNSCPYNGRLMRFLYSHQLWRLYDARVEANSSMRRMNDDPIARFVSQTWYLWFFVELLLIFFIAGWSGLLWGGLVRIFLIHQVTFAVNSICHMSGTHEFVTGDQSGNVRGVLMYLSFGDSLHNCHHAFQYTYDNALLPGMRDPSASVIRFFARCGWAKRLLRPDNELIRLRLKPEYAHSLT